MRAAKYFARRAVSDLDLVTSFDQILGHRLTHDAESEKRNSHDCSFVKHKNNSKTRRGFHGRFARGFHGWMKAAERRQFQRRTFKSP